MMAKMRRGWRGAAVQLLGWLLCSALLCISLGQHSSAEIEWHGTTETRMGEYCKCDTPGCKCAVSFRDLRSAPHHFYPADVLDARIDLLLNVKLKKEAAQWIEQCKCSEFCQCLESEEMVTVLENDPIDPMVLPGNGEDSIIVTIGTSGWETVRRTCPGDKSATELFKAYVMIEHAATNDEDLATRLLLGIIFALVWTLIMIVPIVMWIRRRRAHGTADPRAFRLPVLRGAHNRGGARDSGIRAKPRRFKVLAKSDWEGEPGAHRRTLGWLLADEEICQQALAILEKDVTVMGRAAPQCVVASMEGQFFARLTRPPERGQPRTVELSATPFERPAGQEQEWVLATLPQSVRYSSGVSGEIHIDIFGNVVPWEGTRETGEFRKKVDRLRRLLDRSRRPRFGRDRDEVPVQVARAELFESSFVSVTSLNRDDLTRRFKVQFVGEDGSDFGGVRREWYSLITQEMVKPELGMFEPTEGDDYRYQLATHIDTKCGDVAVGPQTLVRGRLEEVVDHLTFAGKILAKCIVDNQLCAVQFTSAVYKMLLLQPFTVEDLESVDREMYNSLEWVLESNCDSEDLGMFMCVDTTDTDGNNVTIELVAGGNDIPVTEDNKVDFVERMIQWRLVDRAAVQTDALVAGFHSVLPLEYLEAFTASELELLLCGSTEVDIEDWKVNTLYKSGYSSESEVVVWFWDIIDSMKNDERLRLLQFVTGTSSIPSRGFAHLQGSDGERRFSIMRVVDTARLPQAHTCFNELVLPEYASKEELSEKLSTALQHLEDGMLLR